MGMAAVSVGMEHGMDFKSCEDELGTVTVTTGMAVVGTRVITVLFCTLTVPICSTNHV